MGVWKNIVGLIGNTLQLNFTGPKVTGSSTDTVTITDKDAAAGKLVVVTATHENIIVSDGVDKTTTITMATGGDVITMVLPNNDGDAGNALTTDGAGNLSWSDLDTINAKILTLNFDDAASQDFGAAASGRFIDRVVVKVTTAFDGTTPAVSIGITGTLEKYAAEAEIDLTTLGTYSIDVANYESGSEQILASFTAGGGAAAGIAEITLIQCLPTVTA